MKMKKFLAMLCVATLCLSLAACGEKKAEGNKSPGKDTSTGRTDLNIHCVDPFTSLDPHNITIGTDQSISRQIYEPLFTLNDEAKDVPVLATDYTVSEDQLTWTFQLREGVTFTNGEKLKASDVVFSYNRCIDSPYMKSSVEMIKSVSAPDDATVVLELKYPFAPLIENVGSIGIVNEEFTKANLDDQGVLGYNSCGTGAYLYQEHTPDVSLTLVSNPDYWDKKAPIKTLVYHLIPDSNTALTAFQAGELDIIGVPTPNWDEVSSGDEYETLSRIGNHCVYLVLNTESAPFNNKDLRQAVAYAVNRQDIIDVSRDGFAEPATTLATPYMFGYPEEHKVYEQDLEKSKELLAKAGYPDGIDIGSIKTQGGTYFEKVAQAAQAQLGQVGITCTVEAMDGSALVNDCVSGNIGMAVMGQSLSLDYDFLKTFFCKDYVNGLNMARYQNDEIDALFEEGAGTVDQEERRSIYQKIEDITQEDCAYVPLYNIQGLTAWDKNLNYTPTVVSTRYKDLSWK